MNEVSSPFHQTLLISPLWTASSCNQIGAIIHWLQTAFDSQGRMFQCMQVAGTRDRIKQSWWDLDDVNLKKLANLHLALFLCAPIPPSGRLILDGVEHHLSIPLPSLFGRSIRVLLLSPLIFGRACLPATCRGLSLLLLQMLFSHSHNDQARRTTTILVVVRAILVLSRLVRGNRDI